LIVKTAKRRFDENVNISHDRGGGGEDDVSWGGGDRMMTEWRTYSVKNKK